MSGVRLRIVGCVALVTGLLAVSVFAQGSGGTGLVIRVVPEAHLDTPVATVTFPVANPGQVVYSQPITFTAWVRSLPNQQIQVNAQAVKIQAPDGSTPTGALSAIRWSGSMANATGGAATAVCTSGDFSTGQPQPLIGNWNQSGIAKCSVTFALATDPYWQTGNYTSEIDLSLLVQ